MEVKDVNNSLGQVLFNKGAAVSSSQQALGTGFANLLAGQTAMALDMVAGRSAADKAQVDVSVAKKTVVSDDKKTAPQKEKSVTSKDKVSVAEKNTPKKNKKSVAVDDSSSVQANVVSDKPVQQENVATANNQVEQAVAQAEGVVEIEAPVVAEEVVADFQPVEAGETVLKELTIKVAQRNEQNVMAVISGNDIFMAPEMPDLQSLSAMASVSVLDEATGEVKSVSGAELVEKIKEASDNGDLFAYGRVQNQMVEVVPVIVTETPKIDAVSKENNDGILSQENVQTAVMQQTEVMAKTEKELPVEQKFVQKEAVVAEDEGVVVNSNNRDAGHNVEKFAYADEKLAEQASILDEKISSEHKVKVNVKVNEEKIAAATTADLLQDDFALRDIWVSADEGMDKTENPATQSGVAQNTSTAQNSTILNTNNMAAVMPVAAAAVEVVETIASSSTSSAMAAETVSAPMSHVVAGGSEFVNQARAENAKTTETSFRDVLKGMEREVVDQVKVNITKSAVKGIDKINIQLKPEDLGHIEIKMQISKDGKLQAHIISSRPETMEILQKEIQSLEQAFNDAGFEMDDGGLSFSFREGNEAGQDSNSELRSFLGNMFETDKGVETAGNDNLETWNPAQGLNIRV